MKQWIEKCDEKAVNFFHNHAGQTARWALFIIFFWFGYLKILGLSPAGPLVESLMKVTFIEGLSPQFFLVTFGFFEVLLGIFVLFPKLERWTFLLMGFHLITTVMPLFLLPDVAWQQGIIPFVPTLVGQYIIKNAALFALGIFLFGRLKPMSETHHILAEEVDDHVG